MAAKCPAPKPLVYCSGDASGAIQDHIVSICTHPSRDLVGVGDIAGKITLYVKYLLLLSTFYLHMCLAS